MNAPNSPSPDTDNVPDRAPDQSHENQEPAADLWARFAKETDKAFEAFQHYLNLAASERSILAAYNIDRANRQGTGKEPAKNAPSQWTYWSAAFKWKERARAFDDHLAASERQEQERVRREAIRDREQEHQRKLEEYRNNLGDLSSANLATSILLMDIANKRLEQIQNDPSEIAKLPVTAIALLLKTASATAAAASAAQAQALAVDEILARVGGDSDEPGSAEMD